MTIRAYRITGAGRRIELAQHHVAEDRPPMLITGLWPDCACRRCVPGQAEQPEVKST